MGITYRMESFSHRFKYLILFGLLLSVQHVLSQSNSISKTLKHARIELEVKNQIVHLTIKKNNGQSMRNVLYTKSSAYSSGGSLVTIENCGKNVCIKENGVTHTTLQFGNEVIILSRIVRESEAQLMDCYEFADNVEWFGGPEMRYQRWPIQKMYYEEEAYVPTHPINLAVTERYWLSAEGIYIYVDSSSPLFLDQNNHKDKNLCLIAKNKAPYKNNNLIQMKYEIGIYGNPKLAHQAIVRRYLKKPRGRPNDRMIQYPIWSTWARYKADVNENVVDDFTDEIVDNEFPNSQVEIDDNWETCYGSAEFDTSKFPNITQLVDKLKQKGFRVTLWIHPFINEGCEPAYTLAQTNSYFVKNLNGQVHTQWWQGQDAAIIDFTNKNAVTWWVSRLKKLEAQGIDSFKFDAGETSWLPQIPQLTGSLQPGVFTREYVNALAKNFDDNIEVRVGWLSQNLPIFVRMIDKDTTWTWNNGLPTLITTLLQMNLNGYVHVLPDMIGGNGYLDGFLNGTILPPKELFIRWLQANVFMPSLQYSFVPWDFDQETVEISRKFTNLHAQFSSDIIKNMDKSVATGAPLNPPIWWVDPTNKEAHKINDEYLLGEEILVAPVIEEGAMSRDVYLPTGLWKDGNNGTIYQGPQWLKDYPAPLDLLPYYIKQ